MLESLLNAPAAELKLLGEGPGASCAAYNCRHGARCKLHARLMYVGATRNHSGGRGRPGGAQLDADGREKPRLAGSEPAMSFWTRRCACRSPSHPRKRGSRRTCVSYTIKKLGAHPRRTSMYFIGGHAHTKTAVYTCTGRAAPKNSDAPLVTRVTRANARGGVLGEGKAPHFPKQHGGTWRATSTTFAANHHEIVIRLSAPSHHASRS